MHQSKFKRSKATLVQALVSKNREMIKQALGVQKPMKILLFRYKEGKIFFNRGLSSSWNEGNSTNQIEEEVSSLQREEIIKSFEKDFEVWAINIIYSLKPNEMNEENYLTFNLR